MYRCVASNRQAFVQQLAVQYVAHGYWFYVTGCIPEQKDPQAVDLKLIKRYGVSLSPAQRSRRKLVGMANVQYLRHDRLFVLIATHGWHRFFEDEAGEMKDCRRYPVRFAGYSISHRNGHASVRIDQRAYKELKAYFLDLACRRRVQTLEEEFRRIRFEPYAPVRRQVFNIHRAVNRKRQTAGFEPVPVSAVRLRRRVYRVFDQGGSAEAA